MKLITIKPPLPNTLKKSTMDAQQQHDRSLVRKLKKLNLAGSRQRLEALLKAKNATLSDWSDPLASVLRENPTLTRAKAEEMVRQYGF